MTLTNWLTVIGLAFALVGALLGGQHQLIQRLIVAKYEADRKADRDEFRAGIDEVKGQLSQIIKSNVSQGARLGGQERKHSRLVGFLEGKGLLQGWSGLSEEEGD